jgi:hypothetical protein
MQQSLSVNGLSSRICSTWRVFSERDLFVVSSNKGFKSPYFRFHKFTPLSMLNTLFFFLLHGSVDRQKKIGNGTNQEISRAAHETMKKQINARMLRCLILKFVIFFSKSKWVQSLHFILQQKTKRYIVLICMGS